MLAPAGRVATRDAGEDDAGLAPGSRTRRGGVWGYLGAILIVALCTLVSWLLLGRFDPRNLAMVYLLGVAFVAARIGRGPSALASCLAVASLEFFFVPPYFAFAVDDAQYVFTAAVMLVVALLISGLASRVRRQAEQARLRGRRTQILYAMTRDLAALSVPEDIARAATRHLADVFKAQPLVLLADAAGAFEPDPAAFPEPGEGQVARWAFQEGRRAGPGTDAFPASGILYVPLLGSKRVVGVVGLRSAGGKNESLELLETLARQVAVSVERAHLSAQAERVEMEMERERLRNALLSSVSHDLRTPLSSITGAASSLLGDPSLSPEARLELSTTIFEESERLNRLVGNLLDMTRVQSGDLRVAKEPHSLEEVVGSAVRRLRRILRDHPVHPSLPSDLPLVPFDAVLIEQVFVNLLENAVKYTPKGSRIEIAAARHGELVVVEVADAGPGLPPGDDERIFEKFYRGSGGVGLGLAICQAIVAAHGGRIWAQNREQGGAVFRLTLPLADTAPVTPLEMAMGHEPA